MEPAQLKRTQNGLLMQPQTSKRKRSREVLPAEAQIKALPFWRGRGPGGPECACAARAAPALPPPPADRGRGGVGKGALAALREQRKRERRLPARPENPSFRRRHEGGEVLLLLGAGVPGARDPLRPERLQDVPVLPLQVPQGLQEEAEPAEGALDQGLPPRQRQGAGRGQLPRVREAEERAGQVPAAALEPDSGCHEASGRDQAEAPSQVHHEQTKEGERTAEGPRHQGGQAEYPPPPGPTCRQNQTVGREDGPAVTGNSGNGGLLLERLSFSLMVVLFLCLFVCLHFPAIQGWVLKLSWGSPIAVSVSMQKLWAEGGKRLRQRGRLPVRLVHLSVP